MSETKDISNYLEEKKRKRTEDNAITVAFTIITLGIFALLFVFISAHDDRVEAAQVDYPHIKQCVSGTVLQPDGACMEQERN